MAPHDIWDQHSPFRSCEVGGVSKTRRPLSASGLLIDRSYSLFLPLAGEEQGSVVDDTGAPVIFDHDLVDRIGRLG
jgi:hypothetical protein